MQRKTSTRCLGGCSIAAFILLMMLSCSQGTPVKPAQNVVDQKVAGPTDTGRSVTPPEKVAEISDLIKSPKTKGSGIVTITAKHDDCSPIQVTGQINVGRGYRGRADFAGVMFLPGVNHKFIGQVCLFSVHTSFKISGGYSGEVVFGGQPADAFRGGVPVGSQKIRVTVNFGKLDATAKSKLFQIESTSSDPLVLQVTTSGYEYVSGSGTVQTPSGKRYSFHS